jgi:hypothetical protein
VLDPDERRRQASRGELFDGVGELARAESGASNLDRSERPVEPGLGQRGEVCVGDASVAVDCNRVAKEELLGKCRGLRR